MQAVRYRPEIDGLRAVAVLSVIIFHLNNRWLPGGFLGVDIFFVISGFLITNIILSEIQNGSFSFRDFYTRRIKRIYPAFIAAVSLASVIASQIFLYEDFNQMRKTIELSTVFLSNIYLGFRLGYFDLSADENPVLHIWSLAVEEQYYLLYPLLLIFCCKKTKSLRALRHISIILFLILTATSFLPAGFYTDILNQPNTYYLSTLRFPELLVGSLLAVYGQTQNGRRQTENGKRQLLSLLCFGALLVCLFVIDKHDPFIPGITLLLPCLLTALLIRSNYITGDKQLGLPAVSAVAALTAGFSLLSYYLIEQPLRKRKMTFKKAFFCLYLAPSLILVGYNLYSRGILKQEHLRPLPGAPLAAENNFPETVLILGDSHAGHLRGFLDYVGSREGWKAKILSLDPECLVWVDAKLADNPLCRKYRDEVEKAEAVFIAQFYDLRMGGQPVPRFEAQSFLIPGFKARFRETVKRIAAVKPVYVFANNTSISRSPLREEKLKRFAINQYLRPIRAMGDIGKSNQAVFDLVKDIPNVHWVDAQKYLPKNTVEIHGRYLYGDQDHLTYFGSYYMGREFHKHERLLKHSRGGALQ
ncbi:acyltransferase family protein [Neisseria gonorrhoeae]|uniref:acyltransferase family protein n=1 Tax=Neisseria gonorrhoeae TaxID=485 RepID=UPI001BFC98D9|nr:acyltransferase family protein [Neisseria gonorrhoeae]